MSFGDRPVTEIILILLTATLGLSLILTTVAIMVFALVRPDFDLERALTAMGNLMGLIAGAVIGYLAGRRERT